MDVILPSHSLRTFAAAVTCLTKIGKEGYVDFDPLDGLTLRTLNDAKSAYGQYRFAPEFFERCSAPPTAVSGLGDGRRKKRKMGGGSSRGRQRKAGRNGIAAGGGGAAANGGGGRARSRSRGGSGDDDTEDDGDLERTSDTQEDDDDDDRFLCRVSLRTLHAVLRSRRGVHTLRIRSLGVHQTDGSSQSQTQTQTQDGNGARGNNRHNNDDDPTPGTRLQLSLEFLVESPKSGGTLRIVHRLSVSDAEGVTAVASRSACSEIVTSPNVFLRLLDPLKRTSEVALTVDEVGQTVTATSFHHGDAVTGGGGGNGGGGSGGIENNAVLRNAAASAGVLKTEASIGVEEFVEYHWRSDRKEDGGGGGDNNDDDDDETGGGNRRTSSDAQEDDDAIPPGNPPPSRVNEEVTLVFGIKEARAMLQFCSAASTDVEMDAVLCFHWGGRPVVIEAEEEEGRFSAELILATLDHQLVGRGVRRQVGGAK